MKNRKKKSQGKLLPVPTAGLKAAPEMPPAIDAPTNTVPSQLKLNIDNFI